SITHRSEDRELQRGYVERYERGRDMGGRQGRRPTGARANERGDDECRCRWPSKVPTPAAQGSGHDGRSVRADSTGGIVGGLRQAGLWGFAVATPESSADLRRAHADPVGLHVKKDAIQWAQSSERVERFDQRGRQADLPVVHEAVHLLTLRPAPPRGLTLEGAERAQGPVRLE